MNRILRLIKPLVHLRIKIPILDVIDCWNLWAYKVALKNGENFILLLFLSLSCCPELFCFYLVITSIESKKGVTKIHVFQLIFLQILPILDKISVSFYTQPKVIETKYSKHWPSTVVHTFDCVCSKINNSWFNQWFSFYFSSLYPAPLNGICGSLFKFHTWILKQF